MQRSRSGSRTSAARGGHRARDPQPARRDLGLARAARRRTAPCRRTTGASWTSCCARRRGSTGWSPTSSSTRARRRSGACRPTSPRSSTRRSQVFANDPPPRGCASSRTSRPSTVACDPDQLRQVLWNLLVNAAQAAAAREGGAGRRCASRCGPDAARRAASSVEDDGPGHRRRRPGAHLPPVLHDEAGRAPASASRPSTASSTRTAAASAWTRLRDVGRASSSRSRARARRRARRRSRVRMPRGLDPGRRRRATMREFLEILLRKQGHEVHARGRRAGGDGARRARATSTS